MKVVKITYQRTKNLGNYESERLEATADVEEGENPGEVRYRLKQWVLDQLYPDLEQIDEELVNNDATVDNIAF